MPPTRSQKKYGIEIIQSRPGLDIRNLNEIGRCFNANYLLCIKGEDGALIAKGWKRKIPIYSVGSEVLISFARTRIQSETISEVGSK